MAVITFHSAEKKLKVARADFGTHQQTPCVDKARALQAGNPREHVVRLLALLDPGSSD